MNLLQRWIENMTVIAREERTYAETLLQKPKTVDKKIELF